MDRCIWEIETSSSFICFDGFDDGVYIIFLHGTYPDGILDLGTEEFQQIPNSKRITWNNEAVERRDSERTDPFRLLLVLCPHLLLHMYLLWLLSLGKKPTGRWARGSHPSDKMEKAHWMLPNPLEYRPWNSNEKRSYTNKTHGNSFFVFDSLFPAFLLTRC
jgi:hypothetical protein